ncbi:hypothetical protein [Clavibacter tessellarius]|uniref:hypothetical protein n=1 Tax=Clavibacter tessellarius TaxID=31965 RepID=UPI00324A6AAF
MVQPDAEGWPPEDGGRGALAGGREAAFAAAAAAAAAARASAWRRASAAAASWRFRSPIAKPSSTEMRESRSVVSCAWSLGAAGLLLGERLIRPGLGRGRLLQLRLGDGRETGERVLGDGGLLAERLGGARRGDRRRECGVLAVGELGRGAHAGEEGVGVLAAAREEAERDVAAAAPRELRDELADLALGVVRLGLGLLGLGRQCLRLAGRLVERVDRGRVLVGALEGEGRGRLDLAGEAGDEDVMRVTWSAVACSLERAACTSLQVGYSSAACADGTPSPTRRALAARVAAIRRPRAVRARGRDAARREVRAMREMAGLVGVGGARSFRR